MTTCIAYRETLDDEGAAWVRDEDMPYTHHVDGTLLLRVPPGTKVTVNGLPVLGGLQVLEPGDLVRTSEASYVLGRLVAWVEPGAGQRCALTGMSLTGVAVRCGQCGRVYSPEAAEQVRRCLGCESPLDETEHFPPEELL